MSTLLASDAQNTQFTGAHNPDDTLSVTFYSRPIQQPHQTQVENRPIFSDVIYVRIWTPGNALNIIDTPMRDEHKAKFPRQWAHFQNVHGGDAREIGTPLDKWTLLSPAQAEELKALHFRTVEHIANASDLNVGKIGMAGGMAPHMLRTRAQAFLAAAQDSAVPQKQAEEIEKLRQEAQEREERHARDMAEMKALIEQATQKKKPGRKPKALEPENA